MAGTVAGHDEKWINSIQASLIFGPMKKGGQLALSALLFWIERPLFSRPAITA
jgi:hypothetical protein